MDLRRKLKLKLPYPLKIGCRTTSRNEVVGQRYTDLQHN